MFWYASLQLNLLCDSTAEQDENSVRAKLTELPATLKEAYQGILDEITSSKNSQSSREVTQNILKWLLCAQQPMSSETFLEAVSSIPHQHIKAEWAISICRSLVTLDKENDVFEFAHLSVREHLNQAQHYTPSECNIVAAESCLRSLENFSMSTAMNRTIPDSTEAFHRYASLYWPFHFQQIDFRDTDDRKTRLKNKLKTLLVCTRDVSPIFQQWITDVEGMANHAGADSEPLLKLASLKAVPATPLFVASIFGFADLIKKFRLIKGYNLEQTNIHKQTRLCLAIEHDQMETVEAFLENIERKRVPPVDVNQVNIFAVEQFEIWNPDSPPKVTCFATALQAAAFTGNVSIAEYLLEKGAKVDVVAGYYGTALQAAALNGHAEMVELLLKHEAEPNNQGGYHGNALQAAAVSGDLSTVSALVYKEAVIRMPGGHYGTAFMAAVNSRSRNVAAHLLHNQAEINKASKSYGTPLQRAADLNSYDMVELLVTEGAEMGIQGATETQEIQLAHSSALAAAAWGGHTKIVSILLKNGAQADMSHQRGELHLLHKAALWGMLDLARYCIEEGGCDVDVTIDQLPSYISAGKMTPLSFACSEGQTQMVRYLLSQGADLDPGSDYCSSLWLAARRGHFAILRLLLGQSAARLPATQHLDLLNRRERISGQTALHEAAQVGSTESIDILLDHGASFHLDSLGATPLHAAVIANRAPVVELLLHHGRGGLLKRGSTLDVQDKSGAPPLFYAVVQDNVHIVRLLLAAGANVSACDNEGNSILHVAAESGHVQIMQEFFTCNDSDLIRSQLNLANAAGNTPLVEAMASNSGNSHDAAVLLLEQGAAWPKYGGQVELLHKAVADDVTLLRKYLAMFADFPTQRRSFLEFPNRNGKTALHIAANLGNSEGLRLLLDSGAPIDSLDADLQTALFSAITKGHDHCAQLLLRFAQEHPIKATPLVDLRNEQSNTALHEAIINANASAISLFIEYGADVTLLGRDQKSTLHMVILDAGFTHEYTASSTVAALLQ